VSIPEVNQKGGKLPSSLLRSFCREVSLTFRTFRGRGGGVKQKEPGRGIGPSIRLAIKKRNAELPRNAAKGILSYHPPVFTGIEKKISFGSEKKESGIFYYHDLYLGKDPVGGEKKKGISVKDD